MTPVMCGSAFKNKGVQLLLDGVTRFLPNPTEVDERRPSTSGQGRGEGRARADPDKPLRRPRVQAAEDGRYGQLTYFRVYQGTRDQRATIIQHLATSKKAQGARAAMVRMHSDELEDIETAEAGDIVAFYGVECELGRHLHRRQR